MYQTKSCNKKETQHAKKKLCVRMIGKINKLYSFVREKYDVRALHTLKKLKKDILDFL